MRTRHLATLALLTLSGAALAAGADPAASVTTDVTWDIALKDGVPWALLLVMKSLLSTFLTRNESKHWIAQGKTLSILTGLGFVVTSVASWHFLDAPVGGILTALIAAYTLVTHSTVQTKSSGSAAALLAVLCVGALAAGATQGCAEVKPRLVAAGGAALNCETDSLKPLTAELLPLATQFLLSTISADGRSVDTSKLRQAWNTVKSDQGRCALVAAMAALAASTASGGPAAAGLVVDAGALRSAFAAVRADHGWGPTTVSSGTW